MTDHRAEAERWITMANTSEDPTWIQAKALVASAHALLADPPAVQDAWTRGAVKGWDEGRQALLVELGGTWHYYSTDHPTPNPYRGRPIPEDTRMEETGTT